MSAEDVELWNWGAWDQKDLRKKRKEMVFLCVFCVFIFLQSAGLRYSWTEMLGESGGTRKLFLVLPPKYFTAQRPQVRTMHFSLCSSKALTLKAFLE